MQRILREPHFRDLQWESPHPRNVFSNRSLEPSGAVPPVSNTGTGRDPRWMRASPTPTTH
jgi:hypothetical protein